jgi:hypothetical protein
MSCKLLFLALSAAFVASATPSHAQAQLSNEQAKALFQGQATRPGVYQFSSLLSGLCLSVTATSANPPLYTHNCGFFNQEGRFPNQQRLVVLPHPSGGYTVRLWPARHSFRQRPFDGAQPLRTGEIGNCLTVARGVLLGAPRIEARPCDVTGNDWTTAGAPDQRFAIRQVGNNTVEFRLLTGNVSSLDCWTLRNSGRAVGTEVIQWQCNRTPDQLWQAQFVEPIPQGDESRLLELTNWYRTPGGHFSIARAFGVELVGGGDESFETVADLGDYCAKRCTEVGRCRAWTWTAAGYNGNVTPRCSWKTSTPQVANRGPMFASQVMSGFVR